MTISELVQESYDMAVDKGFTVPGTPSDIPQMLMLVVSELSEALEELRSGHAPTTVYTKAGVQVPRDLDPRFKDTPLPLPKPEGFGVELADAVIRIAHLCGALDIDLEARIVEKLAYNATRPYKHGRTF